MSRIFMLVCIPLGLSGCARWMDQNITSTIGRLGEKVGDKALSQINFEHLDAWFAGDLHDPELVLESALVLRTAVGIEGTHAEVDVGGRGVGKAQIPKPIQEAADALMKEGKFADAVALLSRYLPGRDENGEQESE